MKRVYLYLSLLIIIFVLSSCSTSRKALSEFYDSWISAEYIPEECWLKEGEDPEVYYSDDFDSDIYFLQSNYFYILGDSSYNGPADPDLKTRIENFCRDLRAPVALYGYDYTDTRSGVYTIGYTVSSYSIKRYDYSIYYFIPMPKSVMLESKRIGLWCRDLETSDRLDTKRNVGAIVHVIFNDSPAFNANISKGDVIAEVNGKAITDSKQLVTLLDGYGPSDEIEIVYYRNGAPYKATLKPLF